VSLPLLFVVALTGTLLIFYDVGSRFVHGLFLTTPAAAAPLYVPEIERPDRFSLPLSLDDAAAVAERLADGAQASSMYVPGSGDTVKVWLRTADDVRPNVGSWHAWIDRPSGTVTAAMVPSNTAMAAHVDETWVIALHFGSFGGEVVRVIYVLAGLIPVVLLVTGITHWLLRRRPARARTLETSET
jgi:uncharacterized iron-regulated membrane protein